MTRIEAVLKRDRWFVVAGLIGVTAIAWVYLFQLSAQMNTMDGGSMNMAALEMSQMAGMAMPSTGDRSRGSSDPRGHVMLSVRTAPWSVTEFLLTFLMWAVMMVGMMVPSAAPMILLFATVTRRRQGHAGAFWPIVSFAAGYLLVWTVFSAAATVLQWRLQGAGLVSAAMTTSAVVGALLLCGAGLYQWTPLKRQCLHHCQSPIDFFSRHWRQGRMGAIRMGWTHDLYCLGCCWLLMALLFVGGIMNLVWIATLAAFVLLEKIVPAVWVSRGAGVVLVVWGVAVLVQ